MSDGEFCCKNMSENSKKKLPEDQTLSKLCSETDLNLDENGQYFYALPSPKEPKIGLYAAEELVAKR